MFYSQAFGETLSSGVKRLVKYQLTSVSVITLFRLYVILGFNLKKKKNSDVK